MHDTNSGFWSGLRDLNPRSLGPKPSAIPNFAKPGYEIEAEKGFVAVVVKTVVRQVLTHKTWNVARGKVLEPQGKIANKLKWSSTLSKTPKPSAIPNFAKPGYEIEAEKGFVAVVVKTVVRQVLTHKTWNVARGKVLEPQGKIANKLKWSSTLSKTPKPSAIPNFAKPGYRWYYTG